MTQETIHFKDSEYAYVRIAVMRSALINRSEYEKFLHMSLAEISNYLGESEYKQQIAELGVSHLGIDLIEKALNANYSQTIQKIKTISPLSYQHIMGAYLIRNDAENLKTILRGIISKTDPSQTKKLLLPSWNITNLTDLLAQQSSTDFLSSLPKPFDRIVGKNLFEWECAIDKAAFDYMLSYTQNLPGKGALFRKYILTFIEITDVLTLLRLSSTNAVDPNQFILNKSPFIKTLLDLSSFDEKAEYIQKKYKISTDSSISNIELALQKYLYAYTLRFHHLHPFSAYAVLSYLFAKEAEIKNIRKVIQAKHLGIPKEKIMEQLLL